MKTAVIMERKLFGGMIRQNHKTGMLNANDLHKIGNALRRESDMKEKIMGSYFAVEATNDLIKEICLVDNVGVDEVKKVGRGSVNKGTWLTPVLFVDMAMWYSPQLKVRIIKWVIDDLLGSRDESGESYKTMAGTLSRTFPDEFSPIKMSKIANTIAAECKVGTGKDKWQKASEAQLKKRYQIQDAIALISDLCPNMGTAVHKAINKVNGVNHV